MDNDKVEVTPEEAAAEQESLAEAKEDEIRSELAEELGLSEDEDADKLDKLVAREMKNRKLVSTAVRQKIDWRTKATGGKPADKKITSKEGTLDAEAIRKEAAEATTAALEQRDLDDMDHSDTVKAAIKNIAKLNNISIRKAEKDSYIQHLIAEESKVAKANEAADNGTRKGKSGVKIDLSKPLDPKDFDLSTEDGRKAWSEAKAAKRQAQQ